MLGNTGVVVLQLGFEDLGLAISYSLEDQMSFRLVLGAPRNARGCDLQMSAEVSVDQLPPSAGLLEPLISDDG